jgi:predicted Zn-ribbon and HTH transcriptional regulator
MIDVINIFKSWGIYLSPNSKQSELAAKRLDICGRCEHKVGKTIPTCNQCGCVITAKVFTPSKGACPKGKWNKVEDDFFNKK